MTRTSYRRKLIEVALPLDAINKESAREKSIRHGHPSTLHLWWARRPLAACRAVLFSSLVNDPEDDPMYGIDQDVAYRERAKLFDLIEELVKWENSNNPRVINAARLEIARSIAANKVADKELEDDTPLVAHAPKLPDEQAKYLPDPPPEYTPHDLRFKMPSLRPEQVNHFLAHYAPPVLDPFAGGGSIPLEAQRLGLRACASDLNPVAVLINKALIEIPPKFAGLPPVNPDANKGKLKTKVWHGAAGLAEDVRYYGQWMRDEAERRIGHLYPKVKVTEEMAADRPDLEPYIGKELTVIAWLWARTVKSPNPALKDKHVPLVKSFRVSTRKGREAHVETIIDESNGSYEFEVRRKGEPSLSQTVERRGAFCVLSQTPIPLDYVREEARAGNLSSRLMTVVADGTKERVYFSPTLGAENSANVVLPENVPHAEIEHWPGCTNCVIYGLENFEDLFSPRQLVALTTFSDLLHSVRDLVLRDASRLEDGCSLAEGGSGGIAYADAIVTYLAMGVDKATDYWSAMCTWHNSGEKMRNTFGIQAIPMSWDYAEANPFSDSSGNWSGIITWIYKVLLNVPAEGIGVAAQRDVAAIVHAEPPPLVSCDPPYYDNVPYSNLSDFFYMWLRRSIRDIYPGLFGTISVPRGTELVANQSRHGGKENAHSFFMDGMEEAISRMATTANTTSPVAIYYAFKQAETKSEEAWSTGWETFLEAVLRSGFSVVGTWPMRTELANRQLGSGRSGTNVLASSVVLVCRNRVANASMVTRRDFANALRKELPEAIKHLQSGNVAPVDLAQASIGPGMAVFSRYKQVVNADGSPMSVREALQMINQVLDEALHEQEADFDAETRFAVRWFEQYGMTDGPFGDAETLAKAMAVAVSGVVDAGILASKAGKVRLLKREELDADWNPQTDRRCIIWECIQHLIRRLESNGESAAAQLLADIQQVKGSEAGEVARELSYRLYSTCERKSWAEQARSYNGLVISWPEISRMARDMKNKQPQAEQQTMFDA